MNKEVFKKGVALLNQTFPDKKMNTKLLWLFLERMDDERFLKSVMKIIQEKKELFPGTNIIALINEYAFADDYRTAEDAWRIVYGQAQSIGHWGDPNIKDKVILRTIDALGWKEICTCDIERLDTLRAHFFRTYNSYLERDKSESYRKGECLNGANPNRRIDSPDERKRLAEYEERCRRVDQERSQARAEKGAIGGCS